MQQNLRTSSMEALQVQERRVRLTWNDNTAARWNPETARWGAGRGDDGVGRPRGGGCMTKWMRLLALIAACSRWSPPRAAMTAGGGDTAAATRAPRHRRPDEPT